MRFLNCGREAVLIEVDDLDPGRALDAALALYTALREADLPGVTDLVPAARTVLIHLDPAVTSPAAVRSAVAGVRPAAAGHAPAVATIKIPVVYDGPDLADAATLTGLTVPELIERHTATPWVAAFSGFAPGFAYLTGGDPKLDVPRRARPRTAVPAGSVGLAGRFSGVYPVESPGGWQLIGTTTEKMWDLERPRPALVTPGSRVVFTAVPG